MDKEKQRDALFEYINSQKLLEFHKFQQQQQQQQQQSNKINNNFNNSSLNTNINPSSNLLVI